MILALCDEYVFLLQTIAWVAIVGLFSFAQIAIGVLCRHASKEGMLWYSLMVQVGAAVGSFCMVDNVNVCMVYKHMAHSSCVYDIK